MADPFEDGDDFLAAVANAAGEYGLAAWARFHLILPGSDAFDMKILNLRNRLICRNK